MAATATDTVDQKKLEFIEEMTTNVDAVQERVLAEILARNAGAEYLARFGLAAGATDRSTFRAKVPMVAYEDLQPYIRRIADDGDRSPILTGAGNPISEFLTSSGTSGGEPKLIPTVEDDLHRFLLLASLIMPVINQYVPASGLDEKKKKGSCVYLTFVKSETKTPSGLPVRFLLTRFHRSDHFRSRPYDPSDNTSPTAAILCEDAFQSTYAQMLCGLCQCHDVVRVGAPFASGLLRAVRFLQLNWEQLAADVEAGVLTERVTDPSVREAVAGILRPDPEVAQLIRGECSKGSWAGIIRRIWTNTKYLAAIVTGSMAQYVPALNYYSGDLPIVSAMYASSECPFGINLRPMCDPSEVSYTIMPNMAYFEFLPVDETAAATANHLVELARVETGREYEVVVTTYGGLNRYRVGDVLRVTGFHNAAPQFRFVRRENALLSIDIDKTDEAELQRAVERASAVLRRRLHDGDDAAAVLDYTSRACVSTIPGHYVIYWELLTSKDKVDEETLESCCLEMEESLSAVYRQNRVAGGLIGPLEIRVVRSGTFEELVEHAVSRGASIGQHKVPRCVAAPDIIELLDSRVVSNHFSPKLPHWSPDERFDFTGEECSSPSTGVVA